jgi:prophage antirepressor-like protein
MNAVTHFDFKSSSVRIVYDDNGEPLFCLADVCKVLNISRSSDLLQIQRGTLKTKPLNDMAH